MNNATLTPLPRQIEDLCNRVAAERVRPALAQTAYELRRDAERVIESGEPHEAVVGWLRGLLGDALKGQA